jgi:hypothetical protein
MPKLPPTPAATTADPSGATPIALAASAAVPKSVTVTPPLP